MLKYSLKLSIKYQIYDFIMIYFLIKLRVKENWDKMITDILM